MKRILCKSCRRLLISSKLLPLILCYQTVPEILSLMQFVQLTQIVPQSEPFNRLAFPNSKSLWHLPQVV
jgi:hypothetical protein